MNILYRKRQKGFTLLEILLVIAAIGILAVIVLVAINPNRQISQARDAQRRSDVNTIYKAIEQYLIDKGSYPNGINEEPKEVCKTGNNTITDELIPTTLCDGKVDLRVLVPDYIASIPVDPIGGVYRVNRNLESNRISITAPSTELGQNIAINPSTPPISSGPIIQPSDIRLMLSLNGNTNDSSTYSQPVNSSLISSDPTGGIFRNTQIKFPSTSLYNPGNDTGEGGFGQLTERSWNIGGELTGPFTMEGWWRFDFNYGSWSTSSWLMSIRKPDGLNYSGMAFPGMSVGLKPDGKLLVGPVSIFNSPILGAVPVGVESPAGTIQSDNWYHIALTRDSLGMLRLRVNGVVVASAQYNNTANNNPTGQGNSTAFYIGANSKRWWASEIRLLLTDPYGSGNITPPTTRY